MIRRRMRFECMGNKRINTNSGKQGTNELSTIDFNKVLPEVFLLKANDEGLFTFTASPDEVEEMKRINNAWEEAKKNGEIPTADIQRNVKEIVNKFIQPFSTYADGFIREQRARGNSPDTINHYERTIKKMEIFFCWLFCKRRNYVYESIENKDRLKLGALMPYAILEDNQFDYEFREFLIDEEEVNEQTVSTYFRDYRAIAYWGMDEGFINKRNIVVKTVYSDPKEVYTDKEIQLLLKRPDDDAPFSEFRDWAAINWALATGNRIGTVINVKISDIDFDDNTIVVSKQKNKKISTLPMDSELKKVLRFYIEEFLIDEEGNYITEYLFPSSYLELGDKPIGRTSLSKSIRAYNKRRGVEKTSFHLFRHTFVKDFIKKKRGQPFELQKILGHSSMAMVNHYANLYGDDLRQAIETNSILSRHKSQTRGKMIKRRQK